MDAGQAVELIKSRLSLREVVSRYVALKPAGRGRWKGLCPFHQEKTPSFYVDEEKGLFYCFGCKAGGDLFAFVQRAEGLDFPEALERLAEEAGVELPRRKAPERRRELLEVLALAQTYFLEHLHAHPEALAYLRKRGLTEESVARFGLGYAPPKGTGSWPSSPGTGWPRRRACGPGCWRSGRGASWTASATASPSPSRTPSGASWPSPGGPWGRTGPST